jgi:ABC-type transport system substrate-binding protein
VFRALLPIALLAAACTGSSDLPSSRPDAPVVRLGAPTHIDDLSPRGAWEYYHAQVASFVFEGLTRTTADGRVAPGLARNWSVSPDRRVYRFRVRTGVRFHDGKPFGAVDVVRAWENALHEPPDAISYPWMLDDLVGARAYALGEQPGIAGLSVPNDSTLVVRLSEPLAFFPTLVSLPQTFVAAASSQPLKPVGTGPWRWVAGGGRTSEEIRFARNDLYWGGRPLLDSLVYRFVPDSLVEGAFESGWVDLASELPSRARAEWSTRDDIGLVESEAINATRLVINMREPAFQDVRVRRALNHAIAAARLAATVGAATAVRAAGSIPPSLPGSDPDRAPYAFDPPLARRLLREGGYPAERPIRLRVPAPGLADYPPEIGTLLRDYLEAVGLKVELTVDRGGNDDALARDLIDLDLAIWVGDYPDGDAYLYPLYHSDAAGTVGNEGFYGNPALDRLIDASRREADPARRVRLLRAADSLAFLDAPVVYLWFTRTTSVYSLRLAGWDRAPQLSRFARLHLVPTEAPIP